MVADVWWNGIECRGRHEQERIADLLGSSLADDGGRKLKVIACQDATRRFEQGAPCGSLQRLFRQRSISDLERDI